VNNSNLPQKWQIIYRSPDMNIVPFLSNLTHYFIEIRAENFYPEDNGVYSLTISNNCSSTTETVTLKGEQSR